MKKELRNVRIQLCKRTGEVCKATCSCPAGKSGYCNHVMALLYKISEYSLNQLTDVPQEKACTSVLRKSGVPGNKEVVKETVIRTTLTSSDRKKGIPPTLYDVRLNFNQIENVPSMLKLKSQLCKIDINIDFAAHVIADTPVFDDNSLTKYGLQLLSIGSHRHKLFNIIKSCLIYMTILRNKIFLNSFLLPH